MSVYIKYFENRGKNMSCMIEDDSVLVIWKLEIWNKIKKALNIKFHSMPVYDEKDIKAKVAEFNGVVNAKFWGDKEPKEYVDRTCIACISIDSVMIMEKNYHL